MIAWGLPLWSQDGGYAQQSKVLQMDSLSPESNVVQRNQKRQLDQEWFTPNRMLMRLWMTTQSFRIKQLICQEDIASIHVAESTTAWMEAIVNLLKIGEQERVCCWVDDLKSHGIGCQTTGGGYVSTSVHCMKWDLVKEGKVKTGKYVKWVPKTSENLCPTWRCCYYDGNCCSHNSRSNALATGSDGTKNQFTVAFSRNRNSQKVISRFFLQWPNVSFGFWLFLLKRTNHPINE